MTALGAGIVGFWLRPTPALAVGVIGDSFCDREHRFTARFNVDERECTLGCVRRGAEFVLVTDTVGNAGILAGPDGVFMVDAQFPQLTDKLTVAITKVSDGRIRFLVNTHHHPDHTSGDANFAMMGAVILQRDELRAHLAAGNNPPPPAALPMVTYRGPVTVHMNGEDVKLIPVPSAHTDGDTMVYFPKADVLMVGEAVGAVSFQPEPQQAREHVTLYVGPDASIPEQQPESEHIWTRFADAVTNGPPEMMIVDHQVYAEPGVSAIAITVPLLDADQRLSDDYWIVLGQRFFAATEESQILTLVRASAELDFRHGPPFELNAFDQTFDWARTLRQPGRRLRNPTRNRVQRSGLAAADDPLPSYYERSGTHLALDKDTPIPRPVMPFS